MIKFSVIILGIELVSVPGLPRNLLPCQTYVVSTHVFQRQLSLKNDCCCYFKSSKKKIPYVLNKVLVRQSQIRYCFNNKFLELLSQ